MSEPRELLVNVREIVTGISARGFAHAPNGGRIRSAGVPKGNAEPDR